MFTAPFTSAFIVVSHDEQTYRPRSTRLLSRIRPQHEHVFEVFFSSTRSTRMPYSSALYSSRRANRSNSHPWSFLFPDAPQFRESPLSSSRISLRSPTAIFATPSSTHRCTMCFESVWRKWVLRRESFRRAFNARFDGPFLPSVWYSSREK